MIWRKEKKRDQSNKKSGEEAGEVMESFITRWYPDILRYCVWHAPNMSAAEDAAQETFLKLIRYYKEEVEKGKIFVHSYIGLHPVYALICGERKVFRKCRWTLSRNILLLKAVPGRPDTMFPARSDRKREIMNR